MAETTYLTKAELPTALNVTNLDPSVQNAIIQQLISDGLFPNANSKIWVESDKLGGPLFDTPAGGGPQPVSKVQLLEVEGTNVTVQTDPKLKVIVDDGTNNSGVNYLSVIGQAHDVFVALGNSSTNVSLHDKGNDTILAGDGNDTLTANNGNDLLIAGSGNDSLVGGSGRDTLIGGSGQDTLVAGSSNTTLVAGTGNTVIGEQGDLFTTMAGSGHDVYNIFDGKGNSTINLGSGGHDTVNLYTTAGNDTINSGGGVDTINFATESWGDVASYTQMKGAHSGEYLIKFTDGQSVLLNAHADPKGQTGFVIEFSDGTTFSLKGGS
jgi:Ca2+-binding RTX toxin-like protein